MRYVIISIITTIRKDFFEIKHKFLRRSLKEPLGSTIRMIRSNNLATAIQ